jgi:hypothetical protein
VSLRLNALLLSLGLLFAMAVPVAASDTTRERTRSLVAEAVFDPFQGCVEWLVDITPSLEKRQDVTSLFLLISAVDGCTGEDVVRVGGTLPIDPDAFVIDNDLEQASLHVTVEAEDRVSGAVIPVTIDLDWVATGEAASRIRFRDVTEESGQRIIQKIHSVSFPAAVAGTVSLADQTLTLGSPLSADLSLIEVDTTIISGE